MSAATTKRSISNQTDSRKNHQIRFITSSQGRRGSEMKTLSSGETTGLEDGDRLTIISDSDTNYAIQWKNGALLGAEQVNNNHPEFPGMTVASYRLASASRDVENEVMEISGTGRGDGDPDGGNGSSGTVVVKEPEEPIP
ncbi:MAG: hypothetical protein EA363_09800 [Balneolaceae bacterium]|nr:MAG: hypothetical protein EA363_09800 [Balneolaceae bacterium]